MSEPFRIDEYLDEHQIDYKPTSTAEIILDCPRCGRAKLYLNTGRGVFNCFRCEFRGGLVTLVAEIDAISIREAYRIVGRPDDDGLYTPYARAARTPAVVTAIEYPDGFRLLDDLHDLSQRPYWQYLTQERGLTPTLCRRYRMGYVNYGYYGGRVVIPVINGNTLLSWVARDITGKAEKKVLTPRGNQQSRTFFNLDIVTDGREVVVTEGVFDALRDPANCIASFGKRLSAVQRDLLFVRGVRELVIAWDQDAWVETCAAAARLKLLFDVRIARLSAKDPGELSLAEFRECVHTARPLGPLELLQAQMRHLGVQ